MKMVQKSKHYETKLLKKHTRIKISDGVIVSLIRCFLV